MHFSAKNAHFINFYIDLPFLEIASSLYMLPVKNPVAPSSKYLSHVLPELG